MGARLKHLAIVSENYALLARFYQAAFGMKASHSNRPEGAVSLSDGYLGFNFNIRRAGGWGRLDHFGFEIDSVEELEDRLRDAYPRVQMLKRLSIRPFAGLTMHDPAGNYFDLSAVSMENRRDVYAEGATKDHPRHVHHLVLRAMEPELLCSFYRDALGLEERPKAPDDLSHYLFDGQVTLVITPWQIGDYEGGNVEAPGPDHLGFAVESLEQFAADVEHIKRRNPRMYPLPAYGDEGEARMRLFQTCRLGQQHLTDPDGVLLDVVQV
jgi:catechol 2,3-dioxygenase-like lactoylglutathione lyase family enzyme